MLIKTSLRIAAALLAATLACSTASAQQSATGRVSGATVVPLPNATPAHVAAARDLVIASGLSRAFMPLIGELNSQINMTVTQTRPDLIPDMKATLDALQPEFMQYGDEMIGVAARVYTALLSEQECRDAAAFFNSPLGKKYVEAQPSIFVSITPALDQWRKSMSVRRYERVSAEMKKKGHEL